MPKKPKNENPVDYTGRYSAKKNPNLNPGLCCWEPEYRRVCVALVAVQIPPSTTYAVTPMKRPMEEDGEEKSPSKKKKKIQKKGIELTRGRCQWLPGSRSEAGGGQAGEGSLGGEAAERGDGARGSRERETWRL